MTSNRNEAIRGTRHALSATGGVRHIRSGRIQYWSLGALFATATTLAAMRWAEDHHLFVIGSIAMTAASVGYLHLAGGEDEVTRDDHRRVRRLRPREALRVDRTLHRAT